jgi:hypothetical protein
MLKYSIFRRVKTDLGFVRMNRWYLKSIFMYKVDAIKQYGKITLSLQEKH